MDKYTYKIPTDSNGEPRESVIVRSDGSWIPVDPANLDYQAYLAQLQQPETE
jgi:hypothetical protein